MPRPAARRLAHSTAPRSSPRGDSYPTRVELRFLAQLPGQEQAPGTAALSRRNTHSGQGLPVFEHAARDVGHRSSLKRSDLARSLPRAKLADQLSKYRDIGRSIVAFVLEHRSSRCSKDTVRGQRTYRDLCAFTSSSRNTGSTTAITFVRRSWMPAVFRRKDRHVPSLAVLLDRYDADGPQDAPWSPTGPSSAATRTSMGSARDQLIHPDPG